jgi:hypothetical protein
MSIISTEQIQKDIDKLPEEAQYLLIDFIQILRKRYPDVINEKPIQEDPLQNKILDLEDQPFVGMWRDRPETQDSTQWLRNLRKQQWHN